jgi:alkylation response protein AidB-like acyl-CoA dehydrogenase
MPATRLMPSEESSDLIALTRDIVVKELAPKVAQVEASGEFPREVFRTLGRAGLLSLPYPEEFGGGGQPYEVYLQVLEEIAAVSASVGVGVSVHALSCFGLFTAGTDEQRKRWLPEMLSGELLGAYCLSEAHAGSDPAAMKTRAVRDGDSYVLNGAKAWTTHGGKADFYKVMARTSDDGGRGISCFLVPADTPGLSADHPEQKMGLMGSTTATMLFKYAKERQTFGKAIIDHQGLGFVLADMAAAVESARATYLAAARMKDAGQKFSRQASIAKLVCTDNAMKVTTDAVQVFGGAGYTRDFPVERFMREAKVMQIFEGTNQIQRLVIARDLAR